MAIYHGESRTEQTTSTHNSPIVQGHEIVNRVIGEIEKTVDMPYEDLIVAVGVPMIGESPLFEGPP